MFPRATVPPDVLSLLAAQQGLITCQQALGLGAARTLIDRQVRDGCWTPLDRGLYCSGTPPLTFIQRAWAGHLLAGPRSALGGAAALCPLGALPEPETIQLVVPAHSSPRVPLGYDLLRDVLGRLAHLRGILPAIRPEDALLDLVARGGPTSSTRGITSSRNATDGWATSRGGSATTAVTTLTP